MKKSSYKKVQHFLTQFKTKQFKMEKKKKQCKPQCFRHLKVV